MFNRKISLGDDEVGFSLSEVLIGFAIVSISLVITYQAISSSLRTSTISREASVALALAQEKLALVGYEFPIAEGLMSGSEPLDWTIEIGLHDELAGRIMNHRGSAPYAVTVTVAYGNPQHPRTVDLHSIALGQWADERGQE